MAQRAPRHLSNPLTSAGACVIPNIWTNHDTPGISAVDMHSLQMFWGCCRLVHSNLGSDGRGAAQRYAPKPWWAYRGQKQSEKAAGAANAAHPIGKTDAWGGKYVEGGYEIDGQFFPLLGSRLVWILCMISNKFQQSRNLHVIVAGIFVSYQRHPTSSPMAIME